MNKNKKFKKWYAHALVSALLLILGAILILITGINGWEENQLWGNAVPGAICLFFGIVIACTAKAAYNKDKLGVDTTTDLQQEQEDIKNIFKNKGGK